MQVTRSALWAVQGIAVVAIFSIVGGVFWYITNTDIENSYDDRVAQMLRLDASARFHFGRYYSFDDMCEEVGVPDGIVCTADGERYMFEAQLLDGTYHCVDSTGFSETRTFLSKNTLSCT